MKLKRMLKKGGVADIVTLMVIVGLVIALIIAVVLPMIKNSQQAGVNTGEDLGKIQNFTEGLADSAEDGFNSAVSGGYDMSENDWNYYGG